MRCDRRLSPLQQAYRQLTGRVPYQAGFAVQPLTHPHAAGDLRQPQRLLEETVLPERLYGFKVTLTQTQQTNHALDQIGGPHAL